MKLSQADAAAKVLESTGRPMHRSEITEEILRRGWQVWSSRGPGRTPWESVGRAITQEIVHLGESSRFDYEHKGSGTYRLRRDAEDGVARQTSSPRNGAAITVELDDETLAALDARCLEKGFSRAELVARMVKRRLWDQEMQRAEEEWELSYRDDPPTPDELAIVRSPKFFAEPWDPRS